jgi:hypothetical protein
MNIQETPEQVVARVASAFRGHFRMNRLEGDAYTEAPAEMAQVAVGIYLAIMPYDITARDQDRAYEYRSFLEECGFSDIFAHDFISDNQPGAVY